MDEKYLQGYADLTTPEVKEIVVCSKEETDKMDDEDYENYVLEKLRSLVFNDEEKMKKEYLALSDDDKWVKMYSYCRYCSAAEELEEIYTSDCYSRECLDTINTALDFLVRLKNENPNVLISKVIVRSWSTFRHAERYDIETLDGMIDILDETGHSLSLYYEGNEEHKSYYNELLD